MAQKTRQLEDSFRIRSKLFSDPDRVMTIKDNIAEGGRATNIATVSSSASQFQRWFLREQKKEKNTFSIASVANPNLVLSIPEGSTPKDEMQVTVNFLVGGDEQLWIIDKTKGTIAAKLDDQFGMSVKDRDESGDIILIKFQVSLGASLPQQWVIN